MVKSFPPPITNEACAGDRRRGREPRLYPTRKGVCCGGRLKFDVKAASVGLLILALSAGCGKHLNCASVEGNVSIRGKPVERGGVELWPIDGTAGPMVGGAIEEGKFRIPAKKGPLVGGTYRVRIVGMEKTGKKQVDKDRPDRPVDVYRNVIPPEYNRQSKLKVVISEDQPNRLDYALPLTAQRQ